MNLNEFKSYIKTVSNEELDSIFDEISAKHNRARKIDIIAGYAIALDELVLEKGFRAQGYGAIDPNYNPTLEEIFAELEKI